MATTRTTKRKSTGLRLEKVDLLEGARLVRTSYVLHDDRSPATQSFSSIAEAEAAYEVAIRSRS